MKIKDEKYREETRRALNMLAGFQRGQDVPLEAFEAAFGINRDQERLFRALIRKVQKVLWRERKIRMCCVTSGSQRQLTPEENVTIYEKLQREKRYRNAGKTLRTLKETPVGELSLHAQRGRLFSMSSLRSERREMARTRNDAKKSDVHPRRPDKVTCTIVQDSPPLTSQPTGF